MEDYSYSAKDIQVLEDLIAVRKRPSMYIGDTGSRGLHHLVNEAIDNSVDEALVGFCNSIELIVHSDDSITVKDNGRGIPVDIHEGYNISAVEVVMTKLHAGGKFSNKVYKVSGGLHGVGISVVNALSEYLEVEIRKNHKRYFQRYKHGKPLYPLREVGYADGNGTLIKFKPDGGIFDSCEFDFEKITSRLRELAFLNKGLRFYVKDEREGRGGEKEFKYDGGIVSFLEYLNREKKVLHEPFYFEDEKERVSIEIGLQYNETYTENILSFVNNVKTIEGGTHLSGFKAALTRIFNEYGAEKGFLKKFSFEGEDVREGLTAVISVKVREPQFEGQTKTKLGNSEVKGIVESTMREHLKIFLEENPKEGGRVMQKLLEAAKAREAARHAREIVRKRVFFGDSLPGKLADCSEKDPLKREIYLVEGESAGGSAKQARDKNFQAILPIRGKILNVEKARMDRILKSNEIKALITALGTGIGEEFDLQKTRYQKIVIMSDADVDGAHIRTLLLTFFYRYMPQLIDTKRMYVAQPPLYMVRKGKETRYAFTEEEYRGILGEMKVEEEEKVKIQRYKGLGEMNPEQLWETTMNPVTRCIKRITLEDAAEADWLFTVLMGEEIEPRKKFIQMHAKEVRNLDI